VVVDTSVVSFLFRGDTRADRYRLHVACRRIGQPIDGADAWIAATALLYGIPVVTHNPGHFARVPGLMVISEVVP
jgi:predicted nucleic acid-binding protein